MNSGHAVSPLEAIRSLVLGSAESLERGLQAYWPVVNPDSNGLQEANLTTHLASEALARGFHAYPQASNAAFDAGHSRIDLLLLGKVEQSRLAILIEAKKLYSAEKARELVSDYKKISRFQFVPDGERGHPCAETIKYGLLLAITTDPEYMAWWNEPYDYDAGASWDSLKGVIERADLRASVTLAARRPQYVLYAAFRMSAT